MRIGESTEGARERRHRRGVWFKVCAVTPVIAYKPAGRLPAGFLLARQDGRPEPHGFRGEAEPSRIHISPGVCRSDEPRPAGVPRVVRRSIDRTGRACHSGCPGRPAPPGVRAQVVPQAPITPGGWPELAHSAFRPAAAGKHAIRQMARSSGRLRRRSGGSSKCVFNPDFSRTATSPGTWTSRRRPPRTSSTGSSRRPTSGRSS